MLSESIRPPFLRNIRKRLEDIFVKNSIVFLNYLFVKQFKMREQTALIENYDCTQVYRQAYYKVSLPSLKIVYKYDRFIQNFPGYI